MGTPPLQDDSPVDPLNGCCKNMYPIIYFLPEKQLYAVSMELLMLVPWLPLP